VAFGPSVELMTGLTTVLGYGPDEPRTTSMALPDAISGVTAAAALVTALLRKRDTGQGGFIDLALHESAMCMLGEFFVEQQITGVHRRPQGNRDSRHAPQGIYPCLSREGDDPQRTGYLFIGCRTDAEWRLLSDFAGAEWHRDARFASPLSRIRNHDALDVLITEFTRRFHKIDLMADLQACGVPAGAVMVAPEFMTDTQVAARQFFVALGGEGLPPISFPGSPILCDGERHLSMRRAPKLGEHNREILADLLGYSSERIEVLIDADVVTERPPECSDELGKRSRRDR
ncbi:MAG: CoA transferase, partial [Pseudomonadales bacterium]|nr:CoA transferase [Pseudomonadales bacterium]